MGLLTALLVLGGLAPPAAANHGNQRLEVTPEIESAPQGGEHSLTATLYQGDTDTTGGANSSTGPVVIDFSVEQGPNAGETYACTIITGNSNCSISYDGDEGVGTDIIRAWVRGDGPDSGEGRYAGPTDCPNPPDPNEPGSSSPDDDPDCPEGTADPGDNAESNGDGTDVVEMRWTQSVAGPVCIDAEPNSDLNPSGSTHDIEIVATDGDRVGDVNGEFDCSGDPEPGIILDVEITDDQPNAFFESVNGETTNPSGGGPDFVTCTTDGSGRCVVTMRTVSATAEGTNEVEASIAGDLSGDPISADNEDIVEKSWSRTGEFDTIEATPRNDTNEVGDSHAVTALALDEFDNPVSGVLVSFQVTAGPHSNDDLDNDNNTPDGFFGQCITADDGRCSESYTGSDTGEDTIAVFDDDDSDFEFDPSVIGTGDEPSDEVSSTWVASGQGTQTVRIDMETDPNSNNVDENGPCDGDRTPPINETGWNERANPNQVAREASHKICAERFGPGDEPHSGPVTFRITTGPGHFTDDSGEEDLGREITVDEDADGYNIAYLSSIETGDTAVEAASDDASDSGTAPWFAAPDTARNITLAPEEDNAPPGGEHEVVAHVTDKFGNAVRNVVVTLTEDGVGRFVEGGSQVTRVTGAEGRATARTTTGNNESGGQTITAALEASTTDCDEPANDPEAGDPAGNCTSTASVSWTDESFQSQCDREGVICGTEGPDTITGTPGDDIIITFGGDDTVDGRGGNDIIRLGSGDDVAVGGPGDDVIRGGSGNDTLRGNRGSDLVRGGGGDDTIAGGGGSDILRGDRGRDVIRGNRGADTMRGGRGPDTMRGGRGNDIVRGDRGNDSLFGNRGNDTLNGGPGRDTCRGGRGRRDRTRSCAA